jgi:teichuronic acid biosynthesis glycosyltransferase TuaC
VLGNNHLLVISHLFPNNKNTKSGVFILDQLKQLSKYNYDISVVSPVGITIQKDMVLPSRGILNSWKLWLDWRFGIVSRMSFDKIDTHYLRYYYLNIWRKNQLISFKNVVEKKILDINKDSKIDLIHAHSLFPDGVIAVQLAKKLNCPAVISGMGNDIRVFSQKRSVKKIVLDSMLNSNYIIYKSTSLSKLLPIKLKNYSVIHNGVDIEKFKFNPIEERTSILFIGNLVKAKGVYELIHAFHDISKFFNVNLIIIGDGNAKSELIYYAKKHQLTKHISFLGWKKQDDLINYYQRAKMLCLPSYQEGTPNVVMEALSCGTPIVGSNIDGIAEIVTNENGILCQPKSHVDLAEKLKQALYKTWNYKNIRKYAVDELNSLAQIKKINNIYKTCLNQFN